MQVTKEDIVKQARTWLDTKYHHQGRLKISKRGLGGCDCLGLIIGIAKELNLTNNHGEAIASQDRNVYLPIPDGKMMRTDFEYNFKPIPIEDIEPGDLLLFRFHRHPQHCGVVSRLYDGNLGVIHSYSTVGKVVEHRLDEKWLARVVQAYSFYNIK